MSQNGEVSGSMAERGSGVVSDDEWMGWRRCCSLSPGLSEKSGERFFALFQWQIPDQVAINCAAIGEGIQSAICQDRFGSKVGTHINDVARFTGFTVEDGKAEALDRNVEVVVTDDERGKKCILAKDVAPDHRARFCIHADNSAV